MSGRNVVFVFFVFLLGPAPAFSQEPGKGDCVLASAENGQMLTARGEVVSTSHDMLLAVRGCEDRVVLVYAGDPETGVPSERLRRDRNFTRFRKYVEATYKSGDKEICMQCSKYEVEATFTGRFDVATIPEGLKKDNLGFLHDGSGKIVGKAGFGHPAPAYKYRLVIESVSDVVARKLPRNISASIALPMVASAGVPFYPPLARQARVQGIVRVKVTTDGHAVTATRAESGHRLLAQAAEENARTWRFAVHEPTTFTVTYRYKLVPGLKANPNNPVVLLRLPSEVEVSTLPMPPLLDPAPDKPGQ